MSEMNGDEPNPSVFHIYKCFSIGGLLFPPTPGESYFAYTFMRLIFLWRQVGPCIILRNHSLPDTDRESTYRITLATSSALRPGQTSVSLLSRLARGSDQAD